MKFMAEVKGIKRERESGEEWKGFSKHRIQGFPCIVFLINKVLELHLRQNSHGNSVRSKEEKYSCRVQNLTVGRSCCDPLLDSGDLELWRRGCSVLFRGV